MAKKRDQERQRESKSMTKRTRRKEIEGRREIKIWLFFPMKTLVIIIIVIGSLIILMEFPGSPPFLHHLITIKIYFTAIIII